MNIFVSIILLIPIYFLFIMTKHCLDNDHNDAAIGFGFGFVFSIVGYFLFIFSIFGNIK
jgi:hypothetical protein